MKIYFIIICTSTFFSQRIEKTSLPCEEILADPSSRTFVQRKWRPAMFHICGPIRRAAFGATRRSCTELKKPGTLERRWDVIAEVLGHSKRSQEDSKIPRGFKCPAFCAQSMQFLCHHLYVYAFGTANEILVIAALLIQDSTEVSPYVTARHPSKKMEVLFAAESFGANVLWKYSKPKFDLNHRTIFTNYQLGIFIMHIKYCLIRLVLFDSFYICIWCLFTHVPSYVYDLFNAYCFSYTYYYESSIFHWLDNINQFYVSFIFKHDFNSVYL